MPHSPRIWRSPRSDFYHDEPLHAAENYTADELAAIRDEGFDAIWLRGRLYDLMRSTVLPELNKPDVGARLESLRTTIERGRATGVGVYLYFNEPLGLPSADPFWKTHPELRGSFCPAGYGEPDVNAMCTSQPIVRRFFDEAVRQVMRDLAGIAGVILITASEFHSHCWSKTSRSDENPRVPDCPRCAARMPADVVAELVGTWVDAARDVQPAPQVIAWNWSWSMWYPEPQREIIDRLPRGVDLLVDWERGGKRVSEGETIVIDEYSLGYPGPSERFTKSQDAATARGLRTHAKLQVGVTHELATVPNLPLIQSLHAKLAGLVDRNVAGAMFCWNFGCGRTLNSAAVGLFERDPKQFYDADVFLPELARRYFGSSIDVASVIEVWRQFGHAFEPYPFCFPMLYFSPMNDAPAYPLRLEYLAKPMGESWLVHEYGDRLDDTLGPYSLDSIIHRLGLMAERWAAAVKPYEAALTRRAGDDTSQRRREEELSSARMIGVQLRSALEIYRFHAWRKEAMRREGLAAPCALRIDDAARSIVRRELENVRAALDLVRADDRLGFHGECHAYFYDAPRIEAKIAELQAMLD